MNRRSFIKLALGSAALAATPAVLVPERRIWQVGTDLARPGFNRPAWARKFGASYHWMGAAIDVPAFVNLQPTESFCEPTQNGKYTVSVGGKSIDFKVLPQDDCSEIMRKIAAALEVPQHFIDPRLVG